MKRLATLTLALVLAVAATAGCVSSELARTNLSNVRAQATTLTAAGVAPPANAVPAAEALEEATGTVEQILSMGVPTGLAQENLQHVSTMSEAIRVSGIDDPAPDALPVAQEIARQAGATEAVIRSIQPVAGPWWLPVVGLAGAAGAAFTGFKTLRRFWISKHPSAPEEPPPAPKPASPATPA